MFLSGVTTGCDSFACAGMLNSTFGAGAGGVVAGDAAGSVSGAGGGVANGCTLFAFSWGSVSLSIKGRVFIAAHWQFPGFPAGRGSSFTAFS